MRTGCCDHGSIPGFLAIWRCACPAAPGGGGGCSGRRGIGRIALARIAAGGAGGPSDGGLPAVGGVRDRALSLANGNLAHAHDGGIGFLGEEALHADPLGEAMQYVHQEAHCFDLWAAAGRR